MFTRALFCLWTHRSVSKVLDGWFADEEKVRKDAGLLQKPVALPHGRDVFHNLESA